MRSWDDSASSADLAKAGERRAAQEIRLHTAVLGLVHDARVLREPANQE
jgi:hypothetical protein